MRSPFSRNWKRTITPLLLLTLPLLILNSSSLSFSSLAAVVQEVTPEDRLAEGDRLLQLGIEQYQINQFQAALQFWQQALRLYQDANVRATFPQESRWQEGKTLNNLGLTYTAMRQYQEAIDFYEQSLLIAREVSNREEEGIVLNNLGSTYAAIGRYQEAIDFYEQSLVITREIGDQQGEEQALSNLGLAYVAIGQYQEAIDFHEQGLAVTREINDRVREGVALNNLGIVYDNLGQHREAIGFYEQSLLIAREVGDQQGEGNALNNLGAIYSNLRQYQEAISFYEKSLVIFRKIDDQRGEGGVLSNLGLIHAEINQLQEAIHFYEQTLIVVRQISDEESESNVLSILGNIYNRINQYQQAINLHEQHLDISRRLNDRVGEGVAIGNLGIAYFGLGEYQQSIDLLEQQLAMSREISDQNAESHALGNLGLVYTQLGRYQQAIELLNQRLTILPSLNDPTGEAITLNNLGIVYRNLGQYQQAIDTYERSLVIARQLNDQEGISRALTNLGIVYDNIGQYQRAIEFYEQSLEFSSELNIPLAEASTLGNLALAYFNLEQYQQAIEVNERSLTIARRINDRYGEGRTLSNLGVTYIRLEQFSAATNSLIEAVNIYETLRTTDLADVDKISFFDTYLRSYLLLQRSLVAQGETNQALEYAERGRARAFVDLLVSRVISNGGSDAPLLGSTNTLNLADIQRVAREQNATLVQYSVIFDEFLYIWVIQPTGEIAFQQVDLATLDRSIGELVTTSRAAIGVRGRETGTVVPVLSSEAQREREAQQRQNLQRLYQLLIEPIAQHLPTDPEQRVIFIPHQDLFLVPFAALTNAEGQYLIENHTILTSPSVQVLDLTRQQHLANGHFPDQSENLLVVGNPIMPEIWNPQTNQMEQLSSLVGAENEAVAIAETFGTEALLWDGAAKATVVEQMPNAQIIHFATHGLLEYGNPQESGVLDVPGAIALAPSANDSGLLTAAEILQMDLTAELVVLSACDTGRGRVTGDGVVGLSRAFVTAGVPSIIVSLWAVDDAATAELMVEFYDQWRQTGDKAQALRQAMLTTMQNHPDPRLWAAFTLIGEAE